MPAIDPSFIVTGPEWQVSAPELEIGPGAGELEGAPAAADGEAFGSVLGRQIDQLSQLQAEAADAGASLAAGTATDPTDVVMAVERARLSMQLASQLRTKGVEAVNEIFRTQV